MRQEILTGPERRRRWSDEEKIAIVREANGPLVMPFSNVDKRAFG